MILLDTNVVIAVVNDEPRIVVERFAKSVLAEARLAISSVVLFELFYGIARSHPGRQAENTARLDRFLSGTVEIVVLESEDAKYAGQVRADLARRGTPIGPYDVLIAGQALRHGATLVTANTAEFSRVAGLAVENWAA